MSAVAKAAVLALVNDQNVCAIDDILIQLRGQGSIWDDDEVDLVRVTLTEAGWKRTAGGPWHLEQYERPLQDRTRFTVPAPSPAANQPGPFHLHQAQATAHTILQDAQQCILDRAASRDLQQERSMRRTVAAFNALTGHNLSETEGWLFMAVLKFARATAGNHNGDDYVDAAAYCGLAGESAAAEQAAR